MCELTEVQISQLRRKYEKYDPATQGALPSQDTALNQLTTAELMNIFEENQNDPQKWLTFDDLDSYFYTDEFSETGGAKLKDILAWLRETYCHSIGVEYMHLQDPDERR